MCFSVTGQQKVADGKTMHGSKLMLASHPFVEPAMTRLFCFGTSDSKKSMLRKDYLFKSKVSQNLKAGKCASHDCNPQPKFVATNVFKKLEIQFL